MTRRFKSSRPDHDSSEKHAGSEGLNTGAGPDRDRRETPEREPVCGKPCLRGPCVRAFGHGGHCYPSIEDVVIELRSEIEAHAAHHNHDNAEFTRGFEAGVETSARLHDFFAKEADSVNDGAAAMWSEEMARRTRALKART